MKLRLLATFAGLLLAAQAQAASILYWFDANAGTSRMTQALAASSHTVSTASSEADFTTQLALGGWDLVIFFNQGDFNPGASTAVAGWADAGGKAILGDWTRDGALGAAFDVSYTGDINENSVSISNAILGAGVSNPMAVSNPGWGTYSMSLAALAGAEVAASFVGDGSAAIVIGNGGKTIANGFLNDTLSEANGIALFTNQINLLLDGGSEVPEPAGLALLGLALLAAGTARRRR